MLDIPRATLQLPIPGGDMSGLSWGAPPPPASPWVWPFRGNSRKREVGRVRMRFKSSISIPVGLQQVIYIFLNDKISAHFIMIHQCLIFPIRLFPVEIFRYGLLFDLNTFPA